VAIIAVVALVVAALVVAVSSQSDDDDPIAAVPSTTTTTVEDPATPTTAPGPTVPAEVGVADPSAVADLAAYVAARRDLEFQDDVDVRLATDEQFAALIDEFFAPQIEQVTAQAAFYEALGLIPPGTAQTYARELLERYHSALGFYEPVSGTLAVRGTTLDPGVRSVIVHELVHALDDQWFELSRPEYGEDRASEHVTTFSMVTEGDATRIQDQWIGEQAPDEQAAARAHVGGGTDGPLSDYAEFADYGFFAPYQAGTVFVTGLAGSGGERLVDAVLLDPPETTEQVLYPEVFGRRETRVRVPPPPTEGPAVDQGVVGALFWMGVLGYSGSGVAADAADAAVRGWGGDWRVSWTQGDQTCTRIDVVGDTTTDTDELLAALTTWAASRPQLSVAGVEGRVRLELCYQVPPVTSAGNPRQ
jgi:hypothetical protein